MKNLFTLAIVAIVICSCHKKMSPAKPVVVAPHISTDSAVIAGNNANDPAMVGAGKMVYEAKCARCHGLKDPANYTQARWVGLVNSMAPRAKATDEEKGQILAYVQHNAKDAVK